MDGEPEKTEKINIEETLIKALARKDDVHKGDCGKILIVAGSFSMTGAALLCAEAALRTGAGLVYISAPRSIIPVLQSSLREAVYYPVGESSDEYFKPEHLKAVIEKAKECDVTVIGPGIGREDKTVDFCKKFLISFAAIQAEDVKEGKRAKGLLTDADGLYALSEMSREELEKFSGFAVSERTVITPHAGEAARLLKADIKTVTADRMAAAEVLSKKYSATCLVKGKNTCLFARKEKKHINTTGNSGMATAGSGDVLAGIIATLLSRLDSFEAACAGAFLHGLAGDTCKEKFGRSYFTAGDMVKYLYIPLRSFEE